MLDVVVIVLVVFCDEGVFVDSLLVRNGICGVVDEGGF